MAIPNVPLPHTAEKKETDEFISVEQEMADRQAAFHPDAAEGYFTPAEQPAFKPAHDIANVELEEPDDDQKDSD